MPEGPYTVHGPVVTPRTGALNGENGHGTVLVDSSELTLLFQERDDAIASWRYAMAAAPLDGFYARAAS